MLLRTAGEIGEGLIPILPPNGYMLSIFGPVFKACYIFGSVLYIFEQFFSHPLLIFWVNFSDNCIVLAVYSLYVSGRSPKSH